MRVARRLECAQLAAAVEAVGISPNPPSVQRLVEMEERQQAARTRNASRLSSTAVLFGRRAALQAQIQCGKSTRNFAI